MAVSENVVYHPLKAIYYVIYYPLLGNMMIKHEKLQMMNTHQMALYLNEENKTPISP